MPSRYYAAVLIGLVAAALVVMSNSVGATLLDPATLHVAGTAAQAEGSGGHPNLINNGSEFFVYQEANGQASLVNQPIDLIFAVPNYGGGTLAPMLGTATLNGSTSVSLDTTPDSSFLNGNEFRGLFPINSGEDLYAFLGLGSSVDNSNNITNFLGAYGFPNNIDLTGLIGWDIYVVEAETPFNPNDLLHVSGDVLSKGTFILAYGQSSDMAFATAFTNGGLETTGGGEGGQSKVPEPGSLVALGTVLLIFGMMRRRRRQ